VFTFYYQWNEVLFVLCICCRMSVPVAALTEALVYGRSPTAIVGSNPTGGLDVCLLCVVK
jgi:hypothetical protein